MDIVKLSPLTGRKQPQHSRSVDHFQGHGSGFGCYLTGIHEEQDAREAMRVVFFCTHKTYLYAQNEISYEYIQILF